MSLSVTLTATGLGHRYAEYDLFSQTNRVAVTEAEWIILSQLAELKNALVELRKGLKSGTT